MPDWTATFDTQSQEEQQQAVKPCDLLLTYAPFPGRTTLKHHSVAKMIVDRGSEGRWYSEDFGIMALHCQPKTYLFWKNPEQKESTIQPYDLNGKELAPPTKLVRDDKSNITFKERPAQELYHPPRYQQHLKFLSVAHACLRNRDEGALQALDFAEQELGKPSLQSHAHRAYILSEQGRHSQSREYLQKAEAQLNELSGEKHTTWQNYLAEQLKKSKLKQDLVEVCHSLAESQVTEKNLNVQ